jgi:hypothetical protein
MVLRHEIIQLQHCEHRLGKTVGTAHPFHLALVNDLRFNVYIVIPDDRLTQYFNSLLELIGMRQLVLLKPQFRGVLEGCARPRRHRRAPFASARK